MWGFRFFRQSFSNILGGEEQIYRPVHEDIDRLVLLGLPIITYRMLGGAELYAAY